MIETYSCVDGKPKYNIFIKKKFYIIADISSVIYSGQVPICAP